MMEAFHQMCELHELIRVTHNEYDKWIAMDAVSEKNAPFFQAIVSRSSGFFQRLCG
jgi:hypothetical protein